MLCDNDIMLVSEDSHNLGPHAKSTLDLNNYSVFSFVGRKFDGDQWMDHMYIEITQVSGGNSCVITGTRGYFDNFAAKLMLYGDRNEALIYIFEILSGKIYLTDKKRSMYPSFISNYPFYLNCDRKYSV